MTDRRDTVHVLGQEPRLRLDPVRLRLEEESESLGRPARVSPRPSAHFGQAVLRGEPLQLRGSAEGVERPHEVAQQGLQGSAGRLPHLESIQAAFGEHDVSGVQAFVGGPAARAARELGALAYATGNSVAFREAPSLHTAAHEAAHVVQQRAGVQLKDGVGRRGDVYEQHADAVADKVVRGESAAALLTDMTRGTGASQAALQREELQQGDQAAVEASGIDEAASHRIGAFCDQMVSSLGIMKDRQEEALHRTEMYLVNYDQTSENNEVSGGVRALCDFLKTGIGVAFMALAPEIAGPVALMSKIAAKLLEDSVTSLPGQICDAVDEEAHSDEAAAAAAERAEVERLRRVILVLGTKNLEWHQTQVDKWTGSVAEIQAEFVGLGAGLVVGSVAGAHGSGPAGASEGGDAQAAPATGQGGGAGQGTTASSQAAFLDGMDAYAADFADRIKSPDDYEAALMRSMITNGGSARSTSPAGEEEAAPDLSRAVLLTKVVFQRLDSGELALSEATRPVLQSATSSTRGESLCAWVNSYLSRTGKTIGDLDLTTRVFAWVVEIHEFGSNDEQRLCTVVGRGRSGLSFERLNPTYRDYGERISFSLRQYGVFDASAVREDREFDGAEIPDY